MGYWLSRFWFFLRSIPRNIKVRLVAYHVALNARRISRKETKILIDEMRIKKVDADERAAIARQFNIRYVIGAKYFQNETGEWDRPEDDTAHYSFRMDRGTAWMCPECNLIHAGTGFKNYQGVLYPACCSSRAGGRLTDLPSKAELKRPIGMFGYDGIFYRRLKADFPETKTP